ISADWGDFAPRKFTDRSNRLSYHYGLMVNRQGRRFVDKGEDQNLYTYAKFGRAILAQPGARGYQLFDSKVLHLLEPRYETSSPLRSRSFWRSSTSKTGRRRSRRSRRTTPPRARRKRSTRPARTATRRAD